MGSIGYCDFAHVYHDVQYERCSWKMARKPPDLLRVSS
jgi:hypothetical protein